MSQDVDTQSFAEKGRICGSILNALTGRVWSAFPPPSRPSRSVRGARSAPRTATPTAAARGQARAEVQDGRQGRQWQRGVVGAGEFCALNNVGLRMRSLKAIRSVVSSESERLAPGISRLHKVRWELMLEHILCNWTISILGRDLRIGLRLIQNT